MAKHDFGILDTAPGVERYDDYTPEQYHCIPVRDDLLDEILPRLTPIDCFWHTRARPAKALCEYGVNLIPPESLSFFLSVLRQAGNTEWAPLIALLEEAAARCRYVIHYGL